MKGVRFYVDANVEGDDVPTRWFTSTQGNGIAVFFESVNHDGSMECVGALTSGDGDGPYAGTSVYPEYLANFCKRVTEEEAQERFPELYKRVDMC